MKGIRAKSLFSASFAALLLSGCGPKSPDTNGDAPPAHPGIILAHMDTTVSPKDDFFNFANGGYIKNTQIPADQSRWGVFSELGQNTDANVRVLLEAAAKEGGEKGSINQLIGDFYHAAMDTAAIEAQGIKAIQPQLDLIQALKSNDELPALMAKFHRQGLGAGFFVWIDTDDKQSTRYSINFYQGGLGLPERDYYLSPDSLSNANRGHYVDYLSKLLQLGGSTEIAAKTEAQLVMSMETELAKVSMPMVEMRDPAKMYHLMDLPALVKSAPGFDWAKYLEALGAGTPKEFNVATPAFITAFAKMSKSRPIEDWKTYLKVVVLREMAGYMGNDFVNTDFEFNEKTLNGAEKLRVRWKRVVEGMNYGLGMAIGQKYVEKHFSPKAKEIALAMVDNILATMKGRLAELDWLSEPTREKAIHKVETILPKIGYPDKWRDWTGLTITRESYVANMLAVRDYNFQYRLDKLAKPVDRAEWGISPQIVNAYYNPGKNEIVFPAGILQSPFFDENASPELNYGAFGAVIGHELIHAFDDAGSQYDADGNLNMWWTEEDRKNFESRADLVRRQYDAYTVLGDMHVNGQLTLGENIADIFGLDMSYHAWLKSMGNDNAPAPAQGYTAHQRFFIAFGQIWSGMMRDDALRNMIKTNPHSPAEFRVLGPLSNSTAFYEAFGIKEGDGMWRPDSLRADIW